MTLAERRIFTAHHGAEPRGRWMLIAAVTVFFVTFSLLASVGFMSTSAAPAAQPSRALHQTQGPAWNDKAVANADTPACAAALATARRTQGLSGAEAVAVSTAMLRTCDVR